MTTASATKTSTLRTAIKTLSWRVFAGIDSFVVFAASSVYFSSGGDVKLAACSALSAVALEFATKFVWFFLHEKLWETDLVNSWFS